MLSPTIRPNKSTSIASFLGLIYVQNSEAKILTAIHSVSRDLLSYMKWFGYYEADGIK